MFKKNSDESKRNIIHNTNYLLSAVLLINDYFARIDDPQIYSWIVLLEYFETTSKIIVEMTNSLTMHIYTKLVWVEIKTSK